MTNEEARKHLIELIREKEKEGKICVRTIEGLEAIDLNEVIKQPTEGLLYDLNRDKATILTLMDDKWINDYACALVIERLKEHYDSNRAPEPLTEESEAGK